MLKKRLKKYTRRPFTLLELIVAMAIFAIIMLMMLQFFSGAQKIWTDAERKSDVYGDARTAMDLMAMMLQSTYYNAGDTPFLTYKTPAARVIFAVKSPLRKANTGNLFFVSFQLKGGTELDAGDLLFTTLYDNQGAYSGVFPPVANYATAANNLHTYFKAPPVNDPLPGDDPKSVVVKNLTSLSFTPLVISYPNGLNAAPANVSFSGGYTAYLGLPHAMMIKFTLMGDADYRQWFEMCAGDDSGNNPAKEFRTARERAFTRVVYIGQYGDN